MQRILSVRWVFCLPIPLFGMTTLTLARSSGTEGGVGYDPERRYCIDDTVFIPEVTSAVAFADASCASLVNDRRTYTTRVHPTPTSGLVRFDPPLKKSEPFMVLDEQGRLQAMGTLRSHAALDLGGLPAGPYLILFTRLAEQVRVVKE